MLIIKGGSNMKVSFTSEELMLASKILANTSINNVPRCCGELRVSIEGGVLIAVCEECKKRQKFNSTKQKWE